MEEKRVLSDEECAKVAGGSQSGIRSVLERIGFTKAEIDKVFALIDERGYDSKPYFEEIYQKHVPSMGSCEKIWCKVISYSAFVSKTGY